MVRSDKIYIFLITSSSSEGGMKKTVEAEKKMTGLSNLQTINVLLTSNGACEFACE